MCSCIWRQTSKSGIAGLNGNCICHLDRFCPLFFPSHKQHVRLPVSPQPHHQTAFVKHLDFCQSDRWKKVVPCSFNSHLSCYECGETSLHITLGFPGSTNGKEPACQCRRQKRHGFSPCVGKIPWRRVWQPTPVVLPGESHGQRSLLATVHRFEKNQTPMKWLSTQHTPWFLSSL